MAIIMGNPGEIIGHRKKDAFDHLKANGAACSIIPRDPTRRLWVPPFIRRKHREELREFGLDATSADGIIEEQRSR